MLIQPATAAASLEPTPDTTTGPPPVKAPLLPPVPGTTAQDRPTSKKAPPTALAPYLHQNLQLLAGRETLVSTRLSRLLRDNGLKTETPKLDTAALDFAKAARRYFTEGSEEARLGYHAAAEGLFAAEDRLWTALEAKRSQGATTESGGPLGAEASLGRFMQALSPYFPPE